MILALFIAIASEQPCRLANKAVEAAIAAKTRALHGHEYCEFRHYTALGDLDGDGKPDFALTFNVEGPGNGVRSFLFVYLSSAPRGSAPLEAPVGTRGTYLPNRIAAGPNHELIVDTDNWRGTDAMCCPTDDGQLVFEVSDGRLKQRR